MQPCRTRLLNACAMDWLVIKATAPTEERADFGEENVLEEHRARLVVRPN